jgi:hypothetical protein
MVRAIRYDSIDISVLSVELFHGKALPLDQREAQLVLSRPSRDLQDYRLYIQVK